MVNKLIDGVTFLKSKFQTDELDDKLNQAVSQQNWQASTQLLHQIANASYNYQKEQRILTFIWEKLKHKSWKKVLKTLHLVDFLAKNGPTSLVNAFKENIYEFRNFDNYTLVSEGIDRGESIRKQSKVIVDLISDDHFLNDERAKAKQIKERMANVIGSGAYYGNFSNDSGTTGFKKDSYESFGSSNYKPSTVSSSNAGMSFGQSVMKTLHQSKKIEPKQSYVMEKKQPQTSKLNLSKMNERKPDQSKKLFNNLNSKLVKPPQKKVQTSNPPPNKMQPQPPQKKPTAKVDIMDLDLVGFSSQPQQQINTSTAQNSNNNIDPFDFLNTTPSKPQNANQPITNIDLSQQFSLNSQPISKPHQSLQNPYFQPTTQTLPTSNNYQNGVYNQTQKPVQQPSVSPISISLTPSQPAKKQSGPSNLIDFSNFRQELNMIGNKQQKKSIVQQWNW